MCHFFAIIHGRILPITCLSGMFVLMLRIKLNSVEESVKEKEEDESHEERGEEGIRVICGHCFFLSMCGMWSAYQRYRNLLSIVTGRVGPSLIMGRRK